MRHNIWMILLPVIATVCLYVLASGVHAIGDTEGMSADQLIDESNGVYPSVIGDTRFPATPQAARQLEQSISDTSSASTAQHLSSGESGSPQDSRALSAAASNSTDAVEAAASSAPAEVPASSTPAAAPGQEIAGKWSLKLSDARADLTLYQNQGAIIGIGTAIEGNDTRHVTATGSLSGDNLSLDMVFFESVELYKLTLTQSGDSLSGGYVAYPSSGSTWTGNVEGSRSNASA
ncbi:MAG TPA: hypothetical protein VN455_09380 [Methanotrichaceae archaeon]|nr:hypothetical protein [Methanotrichaceae archaeon]